MSQTPVFVPLMTDYYTAVASGSKRVEYRVVGRGWNRQNCAAGWRIRFSCGYGRTRPRLPGTITGYVEKPLRDLPRDIREAMRTCNGDLSPDTLIACIAFKLDADD